MQIHELNNFTGELGSNAYIAIDDGDDTGKISAAGFLANTDHKIEEVEADLNRRINNIIAGGDAPSEAEIIDARLGADGITYPSLGDAIRDQHLTSLSDMKDFIAPYNATNLLLLYVRQGYRSASGTTSAGIDFTFDLDGTVTLNGTATENTGFAYNAQSEQDPWILSGVGKKFRGGIISEDNNIRFRFFPIINGSVQPAILDTISEGEFIIPDNTTSATIDIFIPSGTTLTNVKVKPYIINMPTIDDVQYKVDEINSDMEYLKTAFDKDYFTPDYTVEDGYYYANNGVKSALAGFTAVTIDLAGLNGVKIYGYQATVMAGLIFVDGDGNYMPGRDGDYYHVPSASGYNTLELEIPLGAVTALTSFSTSGGRTYEISGFKYSVGAGGLSVPDLADVIMIPIFGQSLSVGAAATPPISTSPKYGAGIMFNGGVVAAQKATSFFTSFIPLAELSNETPASGCVDKLVEQIQSDEGISVMANYWLNHHVLMVSCGAGSKTIADLKTNYYDGLKNAIQGAKNICDSEGLTLNIPCWLWIQGETDQKEDPDNSKAATDLNTYKTELLDLQTSLNTYVKGVTGQTNDIKCICYQSAAQNIVATTKTPSYTNTAVMGVPTAQMELVRDNAAFIGSTPVYVMDHSTAEPIHLSAIGSKMLGLYCGLASKAALFNETAPTGLCPKSYEIAGNKLTILYDVPVPPIRIDTEWVKEVSHYGFTLLNSSNQDIISSVSVFDDTVEIVCTESPLNAMLFYGFNGSAYKDGRIAGSRGNVCDSAKFIFDGEIGGKRYTLGNYAYSFVKLLNTNTGTI